MCDIYIHTYTMYNTYTYIRIAVDCIMRYIYIYTYITYSRDTYIRMQIHVYTSGSQAQRPERMPWAPHHMIYVYIYVYNVHMYK